MGQILIAPKSMNGATNLHISGFEKKKNKKTIDYLCYLPLTI